MSLKKTIAAHDDAALVGLTSKGVLRRAHRDLTRRNGEIVSVDSKRAEVLADGHSVALDERGPTAATCSCPAAGICRHIVLAVLLLRDGDEEQEQPTTSARDLLCKTPEAELRKFAGADWDKAVTIHASKEVVEVVEEGHSLVVAFPEFDASITFIAGRGLRQAAYKGPKTRQRLLTAIAALAIRESAGVTASKSLGNVAQARPPIAQSFIDDAQLTLRRAVSAVIPGRSEIAYDLLLDLAISTRAEALPRLSGEVRGLANLARLARARDVAFEADVFLRRAARAYALCQGLREKGDDLALTGTIKRDYQPRNGLVLWLLGAARWHSMARARGVTCYAYAPNEKRWFTVSDGRPAGVDPTFTPTNVYRNALWGGGSMQELIGHSVNVPGPSAAADDSLSLNFRAKPANATAVIDIRGLLESDAAFDDWSALLQHLMSCFGSGLRRRVMAVPAVVVPRRFRGFGFNDLEQNYELEIVDANGSIIILSIRGDDHDVARGMKQNARRLKALLIEVSLTSTGLTYRPVTAMFDDKKSLGSINVDFDEWPRSLGLVAIEKIGDFLTGTLEPVVSKVDPLAEIGSEVMDALVAGIGRSGMIDLERLRSRAESAGLVLLADTLKGMQVTDNMDSTLKAAYIVTEIETTLLMTR